MVKVPPTVKVFVPPTGVHPVRQEAVKLLTSKLVVPLLIFTEPDGKVTENTSESDAVTVKLSAETSAVAGQTGDPCVPPAGFIVKFC